MQISHVQTGPSLSEVKQRAVRGSIGLSDWILKAHLFHRVRTSHWREQRGRRREGGWETSETERRVATDVIYCFFPPFRFLTFHPWRLRKGRTESETQSKWDKGHKAERMKASVSDSVCNVLCHAGVTPAPPPTGILSCQEKECFPEEWVPEPDHHVDVGQ